MSVLIKNAVFSDLHEGKGFDHEEDNHSNNGHSVDEGVGRQLWVVCDTLTDHRPVVHLDCCVLSVYTHTHTHTHVHTYAHRHIHTHEHTHTHTHAHTHTHMHEHTHTDIHEF